MHRPLVFDVVLVAIAILLIWLVTGVGVAVAAEGVRRRQVALERPVAPPDPPSS